MLDADALNLLAADQDLKERVRRRSAATILTPHPLEAARLLAMQRVGGAARSHFGGAATVAGNSMRS